MIQAICQRRRHQLTDGLSARALAKDGDIVGIATEGTDIVAYPAQRSDLIQQAIIAGCAGFFGESRVGKVSERAEPVIEGDQHDAILDQRIGLVDLCRSGARLMRAAMDPDHNGQKRLTPTLDVRTLMKRQSSASAGVGMAAMYFLAAKRFHEGMPAPSKIRSTKPLIPFRDCRHSGPKVRTSRGMAPHCVGAVGAAQRRAVA